MRKNKLFRIILICLLIVSCGKKDDLFPTDKRYWNVADYENVVRELKFGIKEYEKLPSLNDPESKVVVEKLINTQNYEVVLDDNELGLKHKNEAAKGFFNVWKDMCSIYTARDKTDKYLYDLEMVGVEKFGLGLQLRYFKLGNDELLADADDPKSDNVLSNINANVNAMVRNFSLYLDNVNDEKAFSNAGLNSLVDGLDTFFPKLINTYPDSDYSEMETKITLLVQKSKSENIKTSLINIQKLIDSKKKKEITKIN